MDLIIDHSIQTRVMAKESVELTQNEEGPSSKSARTAF